MPNFNMKTFARLKKIEEAKEARRAKKAAAAEAAAAAGTVQTPTQYANGSKTGTAKDSADRKENKKMVANRLKLLVAKHPHDSLGMKWKVRHICRWNNELQYDVADAVAMTLAGLAEEWQREFDEYDVKYSKADKAPLDRFFQKK